MLTINNIDYDNDGCAIVFTEFPVKMLSVHGKCLIRIGTMYQVFHENVPSNCTLYLTLPRDTILVMIFTYFIDDQAWDDMYHPSPHQLTSLCSIAIAENDVPVPEACEKIVSRYAVEGDQAAAELMYDSSNSSSDEYQTTDDDAISDDEYQTTDDDAISNDDEA